MVSINWPIVIASVVAVVFVLITKSSLAGETNPKKLRTPGQILRDKVEGDVRIELEVQGWIKLMGLSAGPREHQHFALKNATFGDEDLQVLVGPNVFDRLQALGVADPRKHFVGKTVIVTGKVGRTRVASGNTVILMYINDLSQIESIVKK